MTIWQALYVIVPIAMVLAVLGIYYAYCSAQLFRLRRYEYWSDKFYAAAKPIVQCADAPKVVIHLIESLNEIIRSRMAPTAVTEVFRSNIESPQSDQDLQPKRDEEFVAFCERNPELMANLETVVHAGLLAASYASILGGSQARAILADAFSEMQTRRFKLRDVLDVQEVAEKAHRSGGLVPLITLR